jgi:putative glutathione S-transferase
MGLEDVIAMSVVDPIRDERSWRFTGGEYVDPVNGFDFLYEAYDATEPDYQGRYSVPVLWDTVSGRIVNNESADILRMLTTGFGELATTDVDLYPEPHRAEIDALNAMTYRTLNNAVYAAGFSTVQDDYERYVVRMFETLDALDARLGESRYLLGDEPVETDWRLFTTLVRFDAVYAIHFKCSLGRVVDFPNLWPYARDLYQRAGIAGTVRFDEIRRHYYGTHPQINPTRIVALRPREDWDAPHGRG